MTDIVKRPVASWEYAELTVFRVEVRLPGGGIQYSRVASIEDEAGTRQINNIGLIFAMNDLGREGWEIGEPRERSDISEPRGESITVDNFPGTIQSTCYYSMRRQLQR